MKTLFFLTFLFCSCTFLLGTELFKIDSSHRGIEGLVSHKAHLVSLNPGFLYFEETPGFELFLRKSGFTYCKENITTTKDKKNKVEELGFVRKKNYFARTGPDLHDSVLLHCPYPDSRFSFQLLSAFARAYPEKYLFLCTEPTLNEEFLNKLASRLKTILVIGIFEYDRGIWASDSLGINLDQFPLPSLPGWLTGVFRKPGVQDYVHIGLEGAEKVHHDFRDYLKFIHASLGTLKQKNELFHFHAPLSTFDNPIFSVQSPGNTVKLVEIIDVKDGRTIRLQKINHGVYCLPDEVFQSIGQKLLYKVNFAILHASGSISTVTIPEGREDFFLYSKRVNRFAVLRSRQTRPIESYLDRRKIHYDVIYPAYFGDLEMLNQYRCIIRCDDSPSTPELKAPFLTVTEGIRKEVKAEYDEGGRVFYLDQKNFCCNFDFSSLSAPQEKILEQYIFNTKYEKLKDDFTTLITKEGELEKLKAGTGPWVSEKKASMNVKLEIIDFLRVLPEKKDIFGIVADTMDFLKNTEISRLGNILDSFESTSGLEYIQQTKPLFNFIRKESRSAGETLASSTPQIETSGFTTFIAAPEVQAIYRGSKIRNGAIKGRIKTSSGGIPAASIRVQAVKGSMARYSYTDISTGHYYIPDVPLGVWDVMLYSREFEIPESGDESGANLKAYVENSSVYIMPDISVSPRVILLDGTYRGSVVSSGSTQKPITNATVFVGGKYGAVSDSNGHFYIDGIPPGKQPVVVQASGYQTLEKEIYVVPDQTVSQSFYLVPKEGSVSGHIHPVNYQASVDWSQVHVTVRGVRHDPIVVDRGFFSVSVPIDLGTYTISVYAPYYERAETTINAVLYEGQVLQFPMIELVRKTTAVSFDIFSAENTTGSLTVMVGNYQSPLSSNFSGGRTSWIHGMVVPQGIHKIVTYGAQSLTNPHQESKEMEFELTESRNFSLFLVK